MVSAQLPNSRNVLIQLGCGAFTTLRLAFHRPNYLRARSRRSGLHRTLPPAPRRTPALWLQLDSRDQARRILADGPPRCIPLITRRGDPLSACGRGCEFTPRCALA
jgi:hypothetical protein